MTHHSMHHPAHPAFIAGMSAASLALALSFVGGFRGEIGDSLVPDVCASTLVLTSSKAWVEVVDPASLSFLSQHMHRVGSRSASCGQDSRCGGDYQH
jgi:hypothetical protein